MSIVDVLEQKKPSKVAKITHSIARKISHTKARLDANPNRTTIVCLALLVSYSLLCHLLPKQLFPTVVILTIFIVVLVNFYNYVRENFYKHHTDTAGFSGGTFISEIVKYVKKQNYNFFKAYVSINKYVFIVATFIFSDLLVALKNLDLYNSGTYFALSLLAKFVFVAYYHVEKLYQRIDDTDPERDEKIYDIFYSNINGIFALFFVTFFIIFVTSKYIVAAMYGSLYIRDHSSLPYIALANMFVCVTLIIFGTAYRIDSVAARRILKAYLLIFLPVAIFISIGYVDTVTYFIIGASAVLSIFLYNFALKKLRYTSNTYSLF